MTDKPRGILMYTDAETYMFLSVHQAECIRKSLNDILNAIPDTARPNEVTLIITYPFEEGDEE